MRRVTKLVVDVVDRLSYHFLKTGSLIIHFFVLFQRKDLAPLPNGELVIIKWQMKRIRKAAVSRAVKKI